MRLLGFELSRTPKVKMATQLVNSGQNSGWFGVIREAWAGAFQQVITVDSPRQLLAFPAVFACLTIIAADIAKLCIKLVEEDEQGILRPVNPKSPFWAILKKPNRWQTRIKFIEQWVVSKLLYGNAYILKERDARGMVAALYVLDGQRVKTLVTDSGDIYYEIAIDPLAGVDTTITVPASEIIHDMMVSLWHPLVGVSPLYASGAAATMGNRIQANSTQFFNNMSRPSGMLTAPAAISDEVGLRLKAEFEKGFSLGNLGRLFVAGDGLKYEPMTIPAEDSQLTEQYQSSLQDVARTFHIPFYKIGGPVPAGTSIEALDQSYYSNCLQALIESAELLLDEGLSLPPGYHTQFDLDGLYRMDTAARYESYSSAVKGGWMHPNYPRIKEGMLPASGGDTPYLQQQNFSLEALAKRDAQENPFGAATPPPTPKPAAPEPDDDEGAMAEQMAQLSAVYARGLEVSLVNEHAVA